MSGSLDPRTPVLVGVGTASADAEACVLMAEATVAALADMDRAEALRAEDDELAADGYAVLAEDGHLIATCLTAIELRLRRSTAREDEDDPLRDLEASLLGDGALPSWGASAYSNEDEEPEQAEDDDLFTGIGEDDEEWPR